MFDGENSAFLVHKSAATPSPLPSGVRVFTIVTKSHLAYAKALAVKVEQFHPGAGFTIFVVDPDGMGDQANGTTATIRSAADLFEDETFRLMTGYYNADELCNACKPWAHAALLRDGSTNTTLYLDADIFLIGSLAPLLEDLGRRAILLTPHVIEPANSDDCEGLEHALLNGGIYNGGCLLLNKSTEADRFINWWKHRLRFQCTREKPGLCVDQSWLSFVPGLFPQEKVAICRRAGVNIAHWNLHERRLARSQEGEIYAGDEPAMFIHFSGWDWRNPQAPSKYSLTAVAKKTDCWFGAGEQYADLLSKQGIERISQWPYPYNFSDDGFLITQEMREKLRDFVKEKNTMAPSVSIFRNPDQFRDLKTASQEILEKEDASALRLRISEMKNSWSWRLTKPLRILDRAIRGTPFSKAVFFQARRETLGK